MKAKILGLCAITIILTFSLHGALEADRNIPVPKHTAIEAIKLVQEYYDKHMFDSEKIVILVEYQPPGHLRDRIPLPSGAQDEWSWFVTYTHPENGNSTVIFCLRRNGEIFQLISVNT